MFSTVRDDVSVRPRNLLLLDMPWQAGFDSRARVGRRFRTRTPIALHVLGDGRMWCMVSQLDICIASAISKK